MTLLWGELSFEYMILATHSTTAQQSSADKKRKWQLVSTGYSIHIIGKVIAAKVFYNGVNCISLKGANVLLFGVPAVLRGPASWKARSWLDPLLFPQTLRARTRVSKSEEDEHDSPSGSTAFVRRRRKHSRNTLAIWDLLVGTKCHFKSLKLHKTASSTALSLGTGQDSFSPFKNKESRGLAARAQCSFTEFLAKEWVFIYLFYVFS